MRAEKGRGFRSPSPKIRLRAVADAARLRGIEVERLPIEQRIVRNYATAVVILRRFFDDLAASRYVLPRRIKRVAQSLVDLSAGDTPAFLGVTEARNAEPRRRRARGERRHPRGRDGARGHERPRVRSRRSRWPR